MSKWQGFKQESTSVFPQGQQSTVVQGWHEISVMLKTQVLSIFLLLPPQHTSLVLSLASHICSNHNVQMQRSLQFFFLSLLKLLPKARFSRHLLTSHGWSIPLAMRLSTGALLTLAFSIIPYSICWHIQPVIPSVGPESEQVSLPSAPPPHPGLWPQLL